MIITIDERIELMAVIQAMDNFWDNLWFKLFNKKLFHCKYKENVKNYFEKYKEHETIKLFSKLSKTVHDVSAYISLPLCYSNPPELKNIALIDNNIDSLIKINFPYENLVNSMKEFYEDTNFSLFFENNKNEYDKMLNNYENTNNIMEYVAKIENYLGVETKNYTVILSALLADCYGMKIITKENITYNYSVLCFYDYQDNNYIFGSKNMTRELLWHEISHLTINDLTRHHINHLNIGGKTISDGLIRNYYTDIETIINEYIIRAITIRLFEIIKEEKMAQFLLQDNIKKGFENIESIKNYMFKNLETNNTFSKDNKYIELMEYVVNKI